MTINEQEQKLLEQFTHNKPLIDLVKKIILANGELSLTFIANSLGNTNENLGSVIRARAEANIMVENAFQFMENSNKNKVEKNELNEAR